MQYETKIHVTITHSLLLVFVQKQHIDFHSHHSFYNGFNVENISKTPFALTMAIEFCLDAMVHSV